MVKSRVKQRGSGRSKRRSAKRGGPKRKLNAYFKQMLSAKKQGLSSFSYKNKTYVGRKHARLGMIYSSKK
jgi:hypothetical protein